MVLGWRIEFTSHTRWNALLKGKCYYFYMTSDEIERVRSAFRRIVYYDVDVECIHMSAWECGRRSVCLVNIIIQLNYFWVGGQIHEGFVREVNNVNAM